MVAPSLVRVAPSGPRSIRAPSRPHVRRQPIPVLPAERRCSILFRGTSNGHVHL